MEDLAPAGTLTDAARRLTQRMESGLIGQSTLVERLVICLLTGGHILIEGPPGLAKTRSVRRLSDAVEGSFARIQCTPDLMPSDVTGTQAWRQETSEMVFLPGPVFQSLVLVDEINRAPPKVQSALLEAMAEGQVTSGGIARALPEPFMVVATQNPLEQEGTFPLPEAQLDRFLFHVLLDLPDEDTELAILDLVEGELRAPAGQAVSCLDLQTLAAMKAEVAQVHLSPALRRYIVGLVMATRTGTDGLSVTDRIQHAVSPRGTLWLAAAARARAWLNGRDYAVPEDVKALAPDVLCHRIAPTWRARAAGETSRGIMAEILNVVEPL